MILYQKGHGFSFFDGIFFFCRPDRAQRVEGSVVPAPLSPKEEWKTAHANKNAFYVTSSRQTGGLLTETDSSD